MKIVTVCSTVGFVNEDDDYEYKSVQSSYVAVLD